MMGKLGDVIIALVVLAKGLLSLLWQLVGLGFWLVLLWALWSVT